MFFLVRRKQKNPQESSSQGVSSMLRGGARRSAAAFWVAPAFGGGGKGATALTATGGTTRKALPHLARAFHGSTLTLGRRSSGGRCLMDGSFAAASRGRLAGQHSSTLLPQNPNALFGRRHTAGTAKIGQQQGGAPSRLFFSSPRQLWQQTSTSGGGSTFSPGAAVAAGRQLTALWYRKALSLKRSFSPLFPRRLSAGSTNQQQQAIAEGAPVPPPRLAELAPQYRTAVKVWLAGCTGLVFGMVVIGGITRLTESGLSITEWKPGMSGMKYPASEEEWEVEFAKYRQSPEYLKLNQGMSQEDFKRIFWWEWAHRMLGRTIGLAFGLPFLFLVSKGAVRGGLRAKLSAILLGIGAEGALGWYMVKSGLEHRDDNSVPRVSQYRLTAHLGTAFLIYCGMLWTLLGLSGPSHVSAPNKFLEGAAHKLAKIPKSFRVASGATALLVYITALSGALVAGLDAGTIYNEFPWMGGGIVPEEWLDMRPKWKNFFENDATVQFDHRVLAMTTLSSITGLWVWSRKLAGRLPPRARLAANCLLGMGLAQVTLGITTLLTVVHIPVAAAHQAGSLVLLSVALWFLRNVKRLPK
ncbi:Cytochrome c oxidase assembly protein cox15 [Balamuthia mandrillaris]